MDNPPVRLAKIAIGDGTVDDEATFGMLPTVKLNTLVAQTRT